MSLLSTHRLVPLGLCLIALEAGCGDQQTCDLDSENIVLRAVIIDDDDGIEAEVELGDNSDDDFASLSLCADAGDTLLVNNVELEEVRSGEHYFYVATFAEPAEEYTVTFSRDTTGETFTANVVPPPGFDIDTPLPLSEQSRHQPLELSWTPPGPDEVRLKLNDELGVDCIEEGLDQPVPDTGDFVVPPDSLVAGADLPPSGACDIELSLSRRSIGEVSAGLSSQSTIDALVNRRTHFLSVP